MKHSHILVAAGSLAIGLAAPAVAGELPARTAAVSASAEPTTQNVEAIAVATTEATAPPAEIDNKTKAAETSKP